MLKVLVLLFLLSSMVEAEDFVTFTGQIKDESGKVIPGVSVRISGPVTEQTVTDNEGRFAFRSPSGKIQLTFELDGYAPLESNLLLKSSLFMEFTMRPMNPAETMIVTASRVSTSLLDSPSTGSVLTAKKIENNPAQNYAELLRSLPGVNASQISTRVFRVTTRQVASASRIPTELVLVDGRSMNIDLNGAPGWDTIPIDPSQIERIEVIHGPASVVWGPSAQTGVVNIIQKTPSDLSGTSVSFTGGIFDRDVNTTNQDDGHSYGTNFVYGQSMNDQFSLKISAGFYEQAPLARPTGSIPVDAGRNTGGGTYPAYENEKTTQPKFDFRLDQEFQDHGRLSYSGGIAWTKGTGHSSAGPVIIGEGSFNGYGKVAYDRNNLYARLITNRVNVETSFLFVRNDAGGLVGTDYQQQDYLLEAGNSFLVAGRHFLSLGGVFRIASFDLTLAPNEDRRDLFGAYVQDEFTWNQFRFVLGGRVDKFNITDAIFSPRLAAIYQPIKNQSFRASFSRAFRPPTLLESYQDLLVTASVLDLGQFDPEFSGVQFPILTRFSGNVELQEETTTAFELGYTGYFKENTTASAAFYVNKNDHNIRNATAAVYTSDQPPQNWPLSPELFTVLANNGVVFPSLMRFVNSGPIRYYGLELSLEHRYNSNISWFVNYSYQSDPVSLDAPNRFPESQLFEPPTHRFNTGIDFLFHKYSANVNLQYVDEAFWTDVLSSRFWGETDSFTMVNLRVARQWNDGKITTALNVTNLFNSEIQQHIFGDIVKRGITAECGLRF